ncbi:MAG TPA: sugar ABC transporter permease [Pelagibacterales bacterium]|nr:sugar ABC transporter permease [Pelagibacterales bacterium]
MFNKAKKHSELSDLNFALLMALPVLFFLLFVIIYPLGYAFWMSLHKVTMFGGFKFKFIGLTNYYKVLVNEKFWDAAFVSIRFTLESTFVTIFLGLIIAIILSKEFKYKTLIRSIVIIPWSISLYGCGIMWAQIGRGQTGLFTAIYHLFGGEDKVNLISRSYVIELLALGNAWNLSPLVAFFLLSNISTIPRRLYDLADIDQMSNFKKFWHVTFPPLRFTIFVFTCITAVMSLKLHDFIYTLSQGGPGRVSSTLTYEIYKLSFRNLQLGLGSAMSFYLLFLIVGSTLMLYWLWGRRVEK